MWWTNEVAEERKREDHIKAHQEQMEADAMNCIITKLKQHLMTEYD